ncbi:MAG TPA: BadF/BadG/BcrA/BcrD ATPase family protein [Devosia sp.]|nr:BadF/BadG/BcrA/BcrD ATPase family protein [Devosia sp.]
MSEPIHLGIDVGGTASRWTACHNDGAIAARGQTGGATGHLFNPAEREKLRTTLSGIAAELDAANLAVATVTIGLTGFGGSVAADLRLVLRETLGITDDTIIAIDDMTLAYAAIFEPGQGYLISAGTGSIGLHIGDGGAYIRVGGRGILIDDAGSGSWIALRALDHVFRRLDHTGSFTDCRALSDALFGLIGGTDWAAVRQYVYAGDRGRIGTLALAVGKAAHAGDSSALTILHDAGIELARLAEALAGRAGARPIGFIGGVLALHPVLTEAIATRLTGHDITFTKAEASLAAARLRLPAGAHWRRVLETNASIAR